ncbi:Succinyl-CoA ligase [ADP-forming] subunit beta [Planctomycetes bacterium Pan216]|uniref:Succinate--CoA ligase [ADP-forming] subunit beta n=1 Tax=Kolteria novifilia TaxID=2527975 RepID=A0A518B3S5_9BACT|nr:Succinyl-CoA ligase [ADP-forming] subunit beta [Planctomycetes bacterium Pan216]
MKIHEYQAKQLLKDAGVPIPTSLLAGSADEAVAHFDALGGGVAVVKAQVHAGGRGKGGGVKVVRSKQECKSEAERILANPLITPQTGPEGVTVKKLLVEQATDIAHEYYVAIVLDRASQLPVLMASTEGGMEIEEVAAKTPEKIIKTFIDPDRGLLPYQVRKIGYLLGLKNEQVKAAGPTLKGLAKVYLDKDCSLAEINPWVRTADGNMIALDAKMNFDDNALFRLKDIAELRDEAEEDPGELRAGQAGLSYVKLDGTIGCLVNGAGLAMSTMDIIKYHGGEPANFLDVGGGANAEQVTEAFRIILSDPTVKAVLVNIFGGIMKCDTIATAIMTAFKEVGVKVPLVCRLEGTNVELGRKMLSESGLPIITASDLTDAAKRVVEAA